MKRCVLAILSMALAQRVVAFVALPSARLAKVGSRRGIRGPPLYQGLSHSCATAGGTIAALRMGIFEDISAQMKTAMKSGEKEKLTGLRMIRAAFLTETKTEGAGDSLPDEKCITILRKMSKQQQESIDMYKEGKKEDLAQQEQDMQDLIESFLPKLADEATTEKWADDAIAAVGAKGPSDMGKVMGMLMKQHKTEMDGKLAQKLVTGKLKGV